MVFPITVGFLPVSDSLTNAVCVAKCPTTALLPMPCLPDSVTCQGGTFTPLYTAFALQSYCVPNSLGNNYNLESIFNFSYFDQWAYDLREGWSLLVVSAFASIVLCLLFYVFVRICTGPIIWICIVVSILGLLTVGIFFILQAKGVVVADVISQNLSSFDYNTLIITGVVLIIIAVLMTPLVVCLKSRIAIGAKAVELGSMFLLENCFLVILPITQGILVVCALAGLVAGSVSLYSLGTFSFVNNSAVPTIYLKQAEIAAFVVFLVVGLWLIFFLHGCNHFMLCSAVSVWYFNNLNGGEGSPCGDSTWRLLRYHLGSVTFASLTNGFFFIIKLLANLFSFDTKDDDSGLVSCCLKCLNFLFCIFRMYLFSNLGSCAI